MTDKRDVAVSIRPMTDATAVPIRKAVSGAHVVYIKNATIRKAVVKNSYWIVANDKFKKLKYGEKTRVEVECRWFGQNLKQYWMKVTCLTPPKEMENYSGEVVVDFCSAKDNGAGVQKNKKSTGAPTATPTKPPTKARPLHK